MHTYNAYNVYFFHKQLFSQFCCVILLSHIFTKLREYENLNGKKNNHIHDNLQPKQLSNSRFIIIIIMVNLEFDMFHLVRF